MALTDIAIRKARPSTKTQRLFDAGGLYLEIAPSGGKWWRLKYRVAGREKRISLGTFPAVGLKEARDARDRAKAELAANRDPSELKRQAKQEAVLSRERAFEAVAKLWLGHRSTAWSGRTLAMITASLENHVYPAIGGIAVDEVEPKAVRDVVKAIESAGSAETASRVFQRIRAIYRYAIAHDIATKDPTYPLKPAEIFKPRQVRHRASLSEGEMPALLKKISALDSEPRTHYALELLILTAVRPGELRGMRTDEVDEARALWRIPAARMKMKTVYDRGASHLIAVVRLRAGRVASIAYGHAPR